MRLDVLIGNFLLFLIAQFLLYNSTNRTICKPETIMGCEFGKCASTSPDQPAFNWLRCLRRFGRWKKDMKVHPGIPRDPPVMPRVIVFKETPETNAPVRLTPSSTKDQSKRTKKSKVKSTKPDTSEAILADLRSSGIIMDTITASGCSFEVPVGETQVIQRPPARLAKLIKTPKVKKTREQKEQQLRAKLRDAEKRREELENQFRERMRELHLRRRMNRAIIASTEDCQKFNLESKMLAKEAMAVAIKEEQLQERLRKMEAREEHRSKVLQKKRSNNLNAIKSKIERENKVAPLPQRKDGERTPITRPPTPWAEQPDKGDAPKAPKVYSPAEWNSMVGPI